MRDFDSSAHLVDLFTNILTSFLMLIVITLCRQDAKERKSTCTNGRTSQKNDNEENGSKETKS